VGYVGTAIYSFAGLVPDSSLIFVEEPDIVSKRGADGIAATSPLIREVIGWEHFLPGKADEFFHAHRDLNPVSVIPMTEYATPFAARLAERYGLPTAGLGAAQIMRNKTQLRGVAAAAGIRNPASAPVSGPSDVHAFMKEHPGSIVLKPANRQGAVGTLVIHDPAEVDGAWLTALDQDEQILVPERGMELSMLAEHFVSGPEFSVEMLVQAGQPLFFNVTGKKLYPGARPVELAHTIPAEVGEELTALLGEETVRVVQAVGFADGMVHCEWIVSEGLPYLVECAGRCAGDGIIDLIERAYPVQLNKAYLEVMAGEQVSVELPEQAKGGSSIHFVDVEPGIVVSVTGLEAAQSAEGVFYANVYCEPGEHFLGARNSLERPGFAAAVGDSPAEATRRAEAAAALIRIEVRPVDAPAQV
jgi:biotin carboxylase